MSFSKPMTVGQLFDNSFRLFRENFLNLIIISIILILPNALTILIPSEPSVLQDQNIVKYVLGFVFGFLVYGLIIYPICIGMIANYALYRTKDKKLSLKELFWSSATKLGKYLRSMIALYFTLMCFFVFVYIIVALIIFSAAMSAGLASGFEWESMLSNPLSVVLGLIFLLMLLAVFACMGNLSGWSMMIFPIMENEKIYGFKAVGRMLSLVFKKFWRLLGIMMAFLFFVLVITLMIAGVFFGVSMVAKMSVDSLFLETIFISAYTLIYSIITPIMIILAVLAYNDTCLRLEGSDLILNAGEENKQWDDDNTDDNED